jgi:hypothetical protein
MLLGGDPRSRGQCGSEKVLFCTWLSRSVFLTSQLFDVSVGAEWPCLGTDSAWDAIGGWGNESYMEWSPPHPGSRGNVFRVRIVHACVRSCVRDTICRARPLRRKHVLLIRLLFFVALGVPSGVLTAVPSGVTAGSRLVSRLVS